MLRLRLRSLIFERQRKLRAAPARSARRANGPPCARAVVTPHAAHRQTESVFGGSPGSEIKESQARRRSGFFSLRESERVSERCSLRCAEQALRASWQLKRNAAAAHAALPRLAWWPARIVSIISTTFSCWRRGSLLNVSTTRPSLPAGTAARLGAASPSSS